MFVVEEPLLVGAALVPTWRRSRGRWVRGIKMRHCSTVIDRYLKPKNKDQITLSSNSPSSEVRGIKMGQRLTIIYRHLKLENKQIK